MTTLSPSTFGKVEYDPAALIELFDRARALVPGLPDDLDVEVRIDEDRVTSSARVVSRDPWALELDGGALEDTQRPRTMGTTQATVVFCRLLFEIADRLDGAFGAPPVGQPEDPALRTAWDTYAVGRTARLGVRVHQPRYRYNFRNRLGFSDDADAAFDRLWTSASLTWEQIVEVVNGVRGRAA